jgi:hypothetical protein
MDDERQDEPASGAFEAGGDTGAEGEAARDPRQATRLARSRAALEEAARESAADVARGPAAATREGVELAERASRVVYWPALLCVLAAILLQIRLPGKLTAGPQADR